MWTLFSQARVLSGSVDVARAADPPAARPRAEDVRVDAMTYDVAGHVLEVQLWGAGLDTLQQPQCVLGGATALTSADAGTLRCALPAVPGAGYTTLMLSDLTLAEALQAGVVRTAAFPRSTAAQPPAGGADGGAVVSLVGVGFDGAATGNAWCVFDGARAPALFVSSALLLCEAPASRPGALALHAVSENSAVMVAAGSGAAVFWALVDPVPLSVYPDVGSLLGGTSVTVRGMGLADADGVQCRMGTVGPLPTVPVGDGALACVTPARGTGTALLVLGLNMQQYSPVSQGMPFVYAQAPQALGATPDRGPTFGRSAVDVITDSLGPSPALMLCAVGTSVTPPSAVTLVSITCPLPPGSAGFVRIAVLTTPDESSAAAGTDFLYYEPPTLRAVLPAAASTGGGTLLHVSGAHFAPLELTCALVLGSVASAAQVVSSALLLCEAAPSRSEGPLPLVVSRTGTTVPEHAELMVLYAWLPAVASAVPGAGPATGGTALTLGGQGLHSGDLLACWLGTVGPLAARGSATGSLDCVTPAHAPGAVPAFASWVGEHAPVERALYTFWSPPSLGQSAAPWPDAVPTVGGVASVLALEDVPLGVTLLTLVGRAIATLAAVSQGGVQFLVPSHAPGFVSVELSYDARSGGDGGGALWALAGDLQYVMAPRLLAMVPRLGTADGGTVLHVTGTHLCGGFAQTAVFVRGVRAPGGAFASSALFILEVPPAQAGGLTASVQLTSTATATAGGLPALTEDGAEYVYTPLAQVLLGSGPAGGGTAGGTLVTLRGAGLRDSADLRCHFGSIATTTLGMPSAQTVLCASPAASATGDRAACAVSASNNGGVDRQFSTDAAFHVFAEPVLHFVMPYDGSASGGTRVELTGTGLAQLLQGVSPLLCRFDLLAAAASVGSPTPAGATAWCIAPPHSPGFVALEVSLFGGNHSASADVQFNFLPAPLVIRAWPAKARSDGGTLVSLRGRDLGVGAAPGADVLVRFPGKEPDDGGPPSRGRLVSSVLITVEAPPEAGGASSDATTASVDTADFAYVAAPRLLAAAPMLGSVRGGTVVSLAGVGFVAADAHVCRFGSVGPVAAEYISDSVVRCTTPAHAPGAPVLVGVARANLVDFVSALGVLFEY